MVAPLYRSALYHNAIQLGVKGSARQFGLVPMKSERGKPHLLTGGGPDVRPHERPIPGAVIERLHACGLRAVHCSSVKRSERDYNVVRQEGWAFSAHLVSPNDRTVYFD
ncbi:MAG: hypothetical protein SH850_21010 [Planctomycetaceae bacterium]|nr:hypothetical protein [Planctomycetaceae bacterium]